MMGEWLKHFWSRKGRVTPKDKVVYYVESNIIDFTVKILQEYGTLGPAAEGLVYWCGKIIGNDYYITAAVAPKVKASRYGLYTTHESNARFVEFICDNDLQYISQVHSHPSTWVNHSTIDNLETAFRSEGLVSIVVPSYGFNGMAPFTLCGIHRYNKGKFQRLSNSYIKKHFLITKGPLQAPITKDFRHE